MPVEFQKPMLVVRQIAWDIHEFSEHHAKQTFHVNVSVLKRLLGLRPRVREDENKAEAFAASNWPLMELIASAALAEGKAKLVLDKSWCLHYEIDDETFARLFKKYTARRE